MALVSVLVAGACGDDEAADDGSGSSASGSSSSSSSSAEGEAATLRVAKAGPLGDVLVDEEGFTLYLFTKDSDGSSACTGSCATTWPPLLAPGSATVGAGLDEAKLGTLARSDGPAQVTYAGKPLYRYAPDQKAGDTNGQGVGGVWFAVRPDGSQASMSSGASYAPPSY